MPNKQPVIQGEPSYSSNKDPDPKSRRGQKKQPLRQQDDTQDGSGDSSSSPPNSPQQAAPWNAASPALPSPGRKRGPGTDPKPSRSNKQGKIELNSPTASVTQGVEKLEIANPKGKSSMAPFVRVNPKPSGKAGKGTPQNRAAEQLSRNVDQALAENPSPPAYVPQLQIGRNNLYSLVKQPHTHAISLEHLAQEIKAIYHGLCIVETKLYVVTNEWNEKFDKLKAKGEQPKDTDDIWPTYIGLCRTYLHEHNDFFLASQHPVASPVLHGLANKYNMPARLWKWGIHSPLELMRRCLPTSREWMFTYWTISYQMLGLLLETVDEFETIWLECLGDMSRYKMAIEDQDPAEREHFADVAYDWYAKTADIAPGVGRVFHHQAVLCRRQPLRQLGLYCLALTSAQPFLSTHESMTTLCRSAMNWTMKGSTNTYHTWLVRGCSALFINKDPATAQQSFYESTDHLKDAIKKEEENFRHTGLWTMFILINCMMDFGLPDNVLRKAFAEIIEELPARREPANHSVTNLTLDPEGAEVSSDAFVNVLEIALGYAMNDDKNVLPLLNVAVVFIYASSLASVPLVKRFPWKDLVPFMNRIYNSVDPEIRQAIIKDGKFPFTHASDTEHKISDDLEHIMLQEDHYLSGKAFLPKNYWPRRHLSSASNMLDSRFIEQDPDKFANYRKGRIVYTSVLIAKHTEVLDLGSEGFSIGSGVSDITMSGVS